LQQEGETPLLLIEDGGLSHREGMCWSEAVEDLLMEPKPRTGGRADVCEEERWRWEEEGAVWEEERWRREEEGAVWEEERWRRVEEGAV